MVKASRPHRIKTFPDNYRAVLIGFAALLLTAASVNAQIYTQPNKGNYGTGQHRGFYDSTLFFPTGCGVPTDATWLYSEGFNHAGEKKLQFALYGDSCGNKAYLWIPSLQAWQPIGQGSGIDTLYARGDSAFYKKSGTEYFAFILGSGGSTDTTSLSNRINTKKDKSDSTGPSGYATIAGKAKSFDSLMIVLNNLYKSATDSVRSGGYSSNGHLNKALDSIKLVFNVLYKLTGDSVVLQGYSTNGHLNKSLDSLRLVFNTLLGGKVDTGTKANIYIYNQGTGVPLLSAHDSFLVAKRLFDTARVTWKQRIVGTDTSAYALFDTTGLSGGVGTSVANSTAVIGLVRIPGTATTAKRSDAADLLDTTEATGYKKVFLPLFPGTSKTIFQNGASITFTGGGSFNLDSAKFAQILAPPTLLNYVSLGNSITFGQGATIVDSSYRRRAALYYGLTNIDLSLSGSGMWKAASNFLANVNPGALNFTSLDAGFNDIRRNAWNILTHRKIINGTISVFMNHNMASWVPGDDASVLHSATFATGYQPSSVGGKTTGSHGLVSQTLGDTAHWAFTGTTVGIGLIGGDGTGGFYNFAAFQIYIDNTLVYTGTSNQQYDGVSDGVYDNKRGPMGIYFTGLSAGSHFIKIVQNQATNYLAVDYFCTLVPPSQSVNPLMLIHATHMTSAGYATSPALATSALTDSLNALTDSLAATFVSAGYSKTYVAKPENAGFNTATDIGGDGIHPIDGGYAKVFNSMKSALPSFGIPGTDGTIYHGSDGNYYVSVLGQLKRLAYFGKDSTNNILNQTANTQTGGFNTQTGIVNTITAKSATLNGTGALLNLTATNSQDGVSAVGQHTTGSWLPTHITSAIDGGMLFALQNTSVVSTSAYSAISLYSGGGATSGPAYVRFGNFASSRSFSVGIDPVTNNFGIRDSYFDSANTIKYIDITRNSRLITLGVTTQLNDSLKTPKWPNKSSLAGTDSVDVIDAAGVHYKTPVSLFNAATAPFADNVAIAKNNSDNTKLFKYDLSGISTGTTITETIPNYSFTPAALGHAQTFTGVNTFTASGLFINTSDFEVNSGSAGSLFVSPVDVSMNGAVNYSSVSFTSSFTISMATATYSGAFVTCGTLSAAGVITLPSSGASGRTYKLINTNNTSNAWTFAGATLKDGFGNTLTSFPNGYTYEIFFSGSAWDLKSVSYTGVAPVGAAINASASLSFPNTAAGATSDLTITATGAAVGDLVVLGIPAVAASSGGVPMSYIAFVSATDTVTVRFINSGLSGTITPAASQTFKVRVLK